LRLAVTRLLREHTTGRPLTYTATNCCRGANALLCAIKMIKPQIKPQANLTSHSMASALDSLWIQTQVWITSLNAIHIGGDYMHANCTLNDILRIKARIRATASTMLSTMGSAVDAYYLIPAMLPPTAEDAPRI